MQYAVWIALAVVFIAIAPSLLRGRKDRSRGDHGDADENGGE